MTGSFKWLVETDWLAAHLAAPDVVVLDATLHLPTTGRNARAEYLAGHVPGALFFDIEEISDHANELPHMLPSAAQFASQVRALGIGDGSRIVVYDTPGLYSAARAWWMFRTMGYEDVVVLNGGLKKWQAEGLPVEDGPAPPRQPRHFTARFHAGLVRDKEDVARLLDSKGAQIVDARGAGRFKGADPEPRAGLRSGHMPGALNVPFTTLLNADGTLKAPAELAAVFQAAGVDTAKPIVTTCGSGVTAGVLALALAGLGRPDVAVYDGSWSEWGLETAGTMVVKG
ncbi:MAG: 3-mercaptopyruvate sulfurtransferase [Hyphomicrobiaceae bacterium]